MLIFQPAWHSINDWRLDFIKNICIEEGVPFISDTDLRQKAIETQGYNINELFIPNDGHPTSLSNRLVSEEIKKCVLDSTYLSSLIMSPSTYGDMAKNELRKSLKRDILNSADWMENIKTKAAEKGLSVDSMIALDIEYLIEQQGY
jgi:hypothetical protein